MHKFMYAYGVLPKDNFVEKNGLELKGRYVGHTAPNVKAAIADAMGGCLFLDEAYALEVDAELQAVRVSRSIRAEGSRVVCLFGSDEARLLRASVCTFCDLMAVATRTLEEFGA